LHPLPVLSVVSGVTQFRLPEQAAREVLLVRAIESEDPEGAVLTREDRKFVTAGALGDHPVGGDEPRQTARFLERRSELALERLLGRFPALRRACSLSRWPAWLNWAVPCVALVAGLVSHRIDGNRFNILAFPLIGMLAWNLLVYCGLLLESVRQAFGRRSAADGHPLLRLIQRIGQPLTARLAAQPTLERGVTRFVRDWGHAAGSITRQRANRTLHLGAALFGVGVIAGLLLRARYTAEYQAGWSGTWTGAEHEIAEFLRIILGPASWLTGIALPNADRLRVLRGGGENAGDWLILWAVTAALFVIGPRLILAAWSAARVAVLKERVPVPGPEDFYVRTLLRNALGRPGSVRVVPYAFQPSPTARERLERLLGAALGEKVRVHVDEPVPYGEEDRWLEGQRMSFGDADQLILLFALASTPEAENHGAFAKGIRNALAAGGTGLTVLIDDSSLRERLRAQASAERRLEERLDAWRNVLAQAGLTPVVIGLEFGEEEVSARTLEKALMRSPVPA
jgi:hypothetical protein